MHLFIYVDICKTIVLRKLTYYLFNLVNISFLVMPEILFIRRGIIYFMIEFWNVIWWWQFACNEEWTPDSVTKFGKEEKIRSIYDGNVCGFLIQIRKLRHQFWSMLNVVMPWLYRKLDFALNLLRTTVRVELFTMTESRISSRLLTNDSKSSWHCLGERHNIIKLQSLSLVFFSKLKHSCK